VVPPTSVFIELDLKRISSFGHDEKLMLAPDRGLGLPTPMAMLIFAPRQIRNGGAEPLLFAGNVLKRN
jgi:hypothetical protein